MLLNFKTKHNSKMTVTIIVDSRERKVFSALCSQNQQFSIVVEEAVLNIGDFHIIINSNIYHIIERKTCSDLLSSLVDGRYKEQSFRLLEHPLENKDIYYLIETDYLEKDQRIVSSVYSLNKKGFSVFRTRNVEDTVYFLLCLAKKAYKESTTQKFPLSYISTIKTKKKKDDNVYVTVSLYSALPKISVKTAEAIQQKYPCVEELVQALRKKDSNIEQIRVNGRRISKAVINSLQTYLLNSIQYVLTTKEEIKNELPDV